MTFAQALARIDALNYQLQCIEHAPYWAEAQRELEYLMVFHADSIVQLGKVGQDMYRGYTILERQARQCGFLDSTEHEKLLGAWDAAMTRGDCE